MAKHKVVHFEIPTGDFKKSKEFYAKIFGWKTKTWGNEYMMAMTTDIDPKTQRTAELGGINGGFYKRKSKSQQPSFVVETDSIDKTLEKVKKAGGKVKRAKSPIGDMGFMAEFVDPDGNEMSLWQEVKK
ncbi:MAG: VOC family protein [Deltaproteobacteria bacterium]|nr:VOC family protein [Deltaproteobacteria bacterium]